MERINQSKQKAIAKLNQIIQESLHTKNSLERINREGSLSQTSKSRSLNRSYNRHINKPLTKPVIKKIKRENSVGKTPKKTSKIKIAETFESIKPQVVSKSTKNKKRIVSDLQLNDLSLLSDLKTSHDFTLIPEDLMD